jgi:hypothetical protein
MCHVPIDSLTYEKRKLLIESSSTAPMYIVIERYEICKELKAVFYDIQIGIQTGSDVTIHFVKTRYSQLAKLHMELRLSGIDLNGLKPFPPKSWFGNMKKEFLAERCQALQDYLSSLTHVSTLLEERCFLDFAHLG